MNNSEEISNGVLLEKIIGITKAMDCLKHGLLEFRDNSEKTQEKLEIRMNKITEKMDKRISRLEDFFKMGVGVLGTIGVGWAILKAIL